MSIAKLSDNLRFNLFKFSTLESGHQTIFMNKYKYPVIFLIALIIVLILRIPAPAGKSNIGNDIIEDRLEVNHAKEIREVLTKFDSLYSVNIGQSEAVGGAVVIVYKGQIAMTKCFGVKKAGENSLIDEHTVFRLASVSKTMTGVLAGILAAENAISLDDKVADYIPEFKSGSRENTENMTIRHLLSHTTGLVPYAFDTMVEDQVPLTKIIPLLNEVEIVAPPGRVYAYQNVMFSLFDPVIAAKTNKNFQENITEKIFNPFGMTDASVDFESFNRNENKAFPHQAGENGFTPANPRNRYYVTAPAAGVSASISDMGKFLIAVLGKDDSIFSKKAHEVVFTPQVETFLKRSYYKEWDKIESKHYAIGWRIIGYKNRKIAHHGGYISGYQSEIAICEDEDIGIAVLTNSPNNYFTENVHSFFNLFIEYKDKIKQEEPVTE